MPSTELEPKPDRTPSGLTWLVAVVRLVLPIAGVLLALYGLFRGFAGSVAGWAWFAVGMLLLVVDLVIDSRWSYWIKSSDPDLNRRGQQLVGELVTVLEPIPSAGRGSVRAADTVWVAEGVEAEAGTRVRVSGCNGTVLMVERV
jgi:hypothetical protein